MNRTARLAGALYLCLVPLGIYSFAYVPSVLVVRGDVEATLKHITSSEVLFRTGVASHLISQVIVVFLALTMYKLLSGVNRDRAFAMTALALLCVPISFAAEINSLGVLYILRLEQPAGPATLLLEMQRSGVLLAQMFWGLWMIPLSALVFSSGFLPRWLAIPVLIASAGYLIDSAAHVLLRNARMISPFTALGELPLPLWLLIRGSGQK